MQLYDRNNEEVIRRSVCRGMTVISGYTVDCSNVRFKSVRSCFVLMMSFVVLFQVPICNTTR